MTTELLDLHKNNILNYLFDKNKTIKSENKYHNIELNIMKNTIIEKRFNTYNSKIEKRTFISKEINYLTK